MREVRYEANTTKEGLLTSNSCDRFALRDVEMNTNMFDRSIESALIIYNPISGSGRAFKIASRLNIRLKEQVLNTELIVSKTNYEQDFVEQLKKFQLVFVVGGDGTLSKLVQHLSITDVPVYMLPAGNESLFSKTFEMTANIDRIVGLVKSGKLTSNYYGIVNNHPFFTMLTVGFDSLVISQIGERTSTSSNLMYVKAGLLSLLKYRTPQINLVVDETNAVSNETGYLIIAHNPGYARDLKLVPEATNSEAKLWARFFPQNSLIPEFSKFIKMAFKLPANLVGSRLYTGNHFELSVTNGDYPFQYDGEYGGLIGNNPIIIENSKNVLKVLS